MDGDEVSVETRLTKGNAAPTPVILVRGFPDEQSDMTGSTRESKAKIIHSRSSQRNCK